jgi:hypothetical protein
VGTATAKLYEEYGEPAMSRHGDAVMRIWVVDPDGDGIVGSRLSTRDVQNGETAMNQIHPALATAADRGMKPRLLVVTTENSGGLAFDERCDFELIEREIFAGRCRWVWFRDVKRLIRNVSPFYRFRDLLIDTNTELWLTEYRGGPIDWDEDDLKVGLDALIAERDRKGIYRQTHGPLMTSWLAEGRGWPGAKRFGFRRNPLTKFPEVDPVQWPFVRVALETYIQHEDGGGKGVRAVQAVLAEGGCPMSETSVKRLLRDPIYMTGEYTVVRDGITYECRPIELLDPIPADLFSKVQELLKLRRGKETRNPAGFYPLNGLVEHSCGCRLRARSRGRRETVNYEHYSPNKERVPESCRGWTVEARSLEAAVIKEVRRLAKCQELQDEWAAIARPRFAEPATILDAAQREALQDEITRATAVRDALEADFVMKVGSGEETGDVLMSFHKLTGGMSQQIKAMQYRLAQMDVLDNIRRSTRPPETDPLLTVLLGILTEETPDDPQLIRKRASFLNTVVSKVVVSDNEDGSLAIQLHGPLVPDDVPPVRTLSPLLAAHGQLLGVVAGEEVRGAEERGPGRRAKALSEAAAGGGEPDGGAVQPVSKGYLTAQLDPPVLPKLRRPGQRLKPRGVPVTRDPDRGVAPAWVSPSIPTTLARRIGRPGVRRSNVDGE